MVGIAKPVDPLEATVIGHLANKAPLPIIAELLGLKPYQVIGRIKKLGLELKKGRPRRNNAFTLSYKKEDHGSLPDAIRKKLHATWVRLLREESARLCRKPLEPGELSPADVIFCYRDQLPVVVWRELFGLSEKAYLKIAGATGRKLARKTALAINALLYSSDCFPELKGMPESQVRKVRAIVEKLRQKREAQLLEEQEQHARELLCSFKQERSHLRRLGQTELFKCRGNCGESWQRTKFFFAVDPLMKDGFLTRCKLCDYRAKKARGGKAGAKAKAKNLSPERIQRLVEVIPCLVNKLPTCYIEKIFDLTRKQLHGIVKQAKCKIERGKGETVLLHFRLRQESELPRFSCLTAEERAKLVSVWKNDRTEWQRKFDEKDAKLYASMEAEQARRDREHRSRDPEPCKVNCKICRRRLEWIKDFFPAKTQVAFKTTCRGCYIRTKREEAHRRFKEERS